MRAKLEHIRGVMAERHIGILLVGFLAYFAVAQLISLLNDPVANLFIWFFNEHRNGDTLEVGSRSLLPGAFIFSAVFGAFVVVYLAVLIYWWIYGGDEVATSSGEGS